MFWLTDNIKDVAEETGNVVEIEGDPFFVGYWLGRMTAECRVWAEWRGNKLVASAESLVCLLDFLYKAFGYVPSAQPTGPVHVRLTPRQLEVQLNLKAWG
ncbi:hypothetical protein [Pyrobaculum sp.]|uniref:hypothetical protein n=1 Tax=Pyrobaculum sp. TaxID=2004705 RepID=UPI003D09985D